MLIELGLMRALCRMVCLASAMMVSAMMVSAVCMGQDEFRWNNAAGGTFNDTSPITNWYNYTRATYDGPPGENDRAIFNIPNADPYVINFNDDITTSSFQLSLNDVRFDLGGHTLTLIKSSPYPGGIGVSGGTVEIENGTIACESGLGVGGSSGADGELVIGNNTTVITNTLGESVSSYSIGSASNLGRLRVIGTGSWTVNNSLTVGHGNGELSVENGGNISTSLIALGLSGTGSMTVTGVGSYVDAQYDILIGKSGLATALIENGGIVENRKGYIGEELGSSGEVTVTGAGSNWNNSGSLFIGYRGDGILTIADGGSVTSSGGSIGVAGGLGQATVTGPGSSWMVGGGLTVRGNSTLRILDGGQVTNSTGRIADSAGNHVDVTVSGTGSQWNHSDLFIGGDAYYERGIGSLNIQNGGKVTATGVALLWSMSSLTIDGGQAAFGSFDNSAGGTLDFFDGVLEVNGSGGSFAPGTSDFVINGNSAAALPTLIIGNASTASLSGNLTVADTFQGELKILSGASMSNGNAKLAAAANSTGAILVSGNGSQWSNTGQFVVGDQGHGSLTIDTGAVVSNSGTGVGGINFIGRAVGATGVVTVSGSGTQWNNAGALRVGSAGHGTLEIADGGVVTNTDGFIAFDGGSIGVATVTGNGSQWSHSGNLLVGGTGREIGTGSLGISDGGPGPGGRNDTDFLWKFYQREFFGNTGYKYLGFKTRCVRSCQRRNAACTVSTWRPVQRERHSGSRQQPGDHQCQRKLRTGFGRHAGD
jgi:T5SS/PEP-CTERM-associated repeat protein